MLGFANVYALRVNLSVGLAVMVADLTVMRDGKKVQVIFKNQIFAIRIKPGTSSQGNLPSSLLHAYSVFHLI